MENLNHARVKRTVQKKTQEGFCFTVLTDMRATQVKFEIYAK